MQVSRVLSFAVLAVTAVYGYAFSAEEQAIWVDRHNYFRTTGLPWSAGNMRRIEWSASLASSAASKAAKCSAASSAGVNAYQSSSSNSSSIIDDAMNQWVVKTSLSTLESVKAPGASDVEIGTGIYNSYSQVIWAATYSVGCAVASCSGVDTVVCQYSPAGNNKGSPWYRHAATASECPTGTTASLGLCVTQDKSTDTLIPAGMHTYQVYPAYVTEMNAVLLKAARAIADGSATSTKTSSPEPATTCTPSLAPEISHSKRTKSGTSTAGSSSKPNSSDNPGKVKPGSDSGSHFSNQTPSVGSPAQQQLPSTPATASQSEAGEETSISNKSAVEASSGISAAGVAGMVVLAVVGVAAFGVVMSYKQNQKRQREIMRDGGIRLI